MSDYFGVPNMANIPNPSEWKHADTAKAWAEKANNAEAHVEAMVEGLEDGLNDIDTKLRQVNTRLEEVSSEIESSATTAAQAAATASAASVQAAAAVETVTAAGTTATTKAAEATTAATNANTYKTTAQNAANDAITAKNTAISSATSASQSASSASLSATSAATSAETAELYATNAAATAQTVNAAVEEAEEYAEAAESSAARAQARYVDADNAATAAQTSANSAATIASNAAQYSQAAAASATQAETAATNANTSKTAAAGSATTAQSAATIATAKAVAASESADDAAESATASAASATAAGNSATSAATSATSASSSATNASNSATAAASSASDAEDAATRAEAAAEIAEVHIEDNLTSDNALHVLSAKQGKVLKGLIDNVPIVPVVDNFNSTSSTSALSANKGKELNDLFNGTIHHDHRVRVHINLPYKDHMNDNDGFNHTTLGLGFSGANFCPDSNYQYAGIDRYSGITGQYVYNRSLTGVSHTALNYTNCSTSGMQGSYYNASPGKTNWYTTTGTSAVGRLHTGWASFIIPGSITSLYKDSYCSNSYSAPYNYTCTSLPYTKTFVPACDDITEDAVPYLSTLNDSYATSIAKSMYTNVRGFTSAYTHGLSLGTYTPTNGQPLTGHSMLNENRISYTLPYKLNYYKSGGMESLENPYMTFYAGVNFMIRTLANRDNNPAGYYYKDTSYGVSNPDFSGMYSSVIDSNLDFLNLGYKNHWHDNPLLPYSFDINNNTSIRLKNSSSSDPKLCNDFYSRFSNLTSSGATQSNSTTTPHMVLGIRYFDATAQEWRVFSPGDNCSYGYDGTHWNYREYLWVDLDKPVTYIVGGLFSKTTSSSDGGAKSVYSQFPMGMSGTYSPYMVNTYGNSLLPSSWSVATNQTDLIHVETPNFDNHTSYSTWRKMTLMTVDYSSSPLNYTNTLYCADSSYGAEETGVLDTTRVSCMYSPQNRFITGSVNSNVSENKSVMTDALTVYEPGVNTRYSSSSSTALLNKLHLFVGNPHSNATGYTMDMSLEGTEHSAYHIRIGLES